MKLLWIPLLLALLASCTSVKKSQRTNRSKTDSAHVLKQKEVDSTGTLQVEVKKKEESSGTEITIDFDSTDFNLAPETNYPPKPDDYILVDSVPVKKKKSITIEVPKGRGVKIDLGDHRPAKINIKQNDQQLATDSSAKQTATVSKKEKTDSTKVTTETASTESSKRKTKLLPLLGVGAGLALVWWLIAWWRKKKKEILS